MVHSVNVIRIVVVTVVSALVKVVQEKGTVHVVTTVNVLKDAVVYRRL